MSDPQNRTANRTAKGRFGKGNSGNPGGKRRDFSREVRRQTKDGKELLKVVLGVLRDTEATGSERLAAASWLADRGWGKPAQTLEHSGPEGQDLKIVLKWTDAA